MEYDVDRFGIRYCARGVMHQPYLYIANAGHATGFCHESVATRPDSTRTCKGGKVVSKHWKASSDTAYGVWQ